MKLDYYIESVNSNSTVAKAKKIATVAHYGQKRKDNTEYIIHPKRVVGHLVKNVQHPKLNDLAAAAYLHDTIEDTNLSINEIKKDFGEFIASLVNELTSDNNEIKKIGKTNYLKNKMLNMTDDALLIKLSDRIDNISDLKNSNDEKFIKKYTKETIEIINELESKRKLNSNQKKLINKIKKKLSNILEIYKSIFNEEQIVAGNNIPVTPGMIGTQNISPNFYLAYSKKKPKIVEIPTQPVDLNGNSLNASKFENYLNKAIKERKKKKIKKDLKKYLKI